MSQLGSDGSELERMSKLKNTSYHVRFSKPDPPVQHLAADIVPRPTSDISHHPSRPPNLTQPWHIQPTLIRIAPAGMTSHGTSPESTTRIPSSMGNNNASSGDLNQGHVPYANPDASCSNEHLGRLTEESTREPVRDSDQSADDRPVAPSHDWQHHQSDTTLHRNIQSSQEVRLNPSSSLGELGHLYKLPSLASTNQTQLYTPGVYNPVYTTAASVAAPQYSYVDPSTVKVTTVVTYSPYLSGYPVSFPVVTQGTVGSGAYPTVDSYSAMLASLGSQVQQTQNAQLPARMILPQGIIPFQYSAQPVQNPTDVNLLPKVTSAEGVSMIRYVDQSVMPGLFPAGQQIFTVPLRPGFISMPPRTEEDPSQERKQKREQPSRTILPKIPEETVQQPSPFLKPSTQSHLIFEKPETESVAHSTAVEYLPGSNERHSYQETCPQYEQRGKDSNHTPGKDLSTIYEEHPNWKSGGSYNQRIKSPTRERYSSSLPQQAEQVALAHVRFHLSPSPHARPSSTITQPPSQVEKPASETTGHAPPPDIQAGCVSEPTTHSSQERLAYSSAVGPGRPDLPEATCQPSQATSHPSQATSHPSQATSHPSQATSHPSQATSHPSQATSHPSQATSHPSQATSHRVPATPTFSNIPSYFTRGSVIQLASGELKRVEDMRTEDFLHSSEMCEGLEIDSSTVVRIDEQADNSVALISFLVGKHKAQVSLEAPVEHPFFVFGQGWSAVRPECSLKSYHLGCHRLAVGDVCVSLTVKDKNWRQLQQPQNLIAHLPAQPRPQPQPAAAAQGAFPNTSNELPSWPSKPKRPRPQERVPEDDWKSRVDPETIPPWQPTTPRGKTSHGMSHDFQAPLAVTRALTKTSPVSSVNTKYTEKADGTGEPVHGTLHAFQAPLAVSRCVTRENRVTSAAAVDKTDTNVEPPSSLRRTFQEPLSVRLTVTKDNPLTINPKYTEKTDSNANMLLVRTTDTVAGGESENGNKAMPPKMESKPLQPLKRRWSDPMHMARLAAEEKRLRLATKSTSHQ